MKKSSFVLLFLVFIAFTGFSQGNGISEKNEIIRFRKEMMNNFPFHNGNHFDNNHFATNGLKSVQDDYGKPPDWAWVNTYGGSGADVARDVAVAPDGSFYVTGSFSGKINIGTNNYTSVGRRDAFLAKFQDDGSLVWFNQLSPLPGERADAYGIHLDNSGNLYFTGYYSGDVNFGDVNLPGTHTKNLFLAKANSNGEITMATGHSTSDSEELGLKVDTDNDGNIFVLGSTDGTTSRWHPSVIIKYAADGSMIFDYYHAQNFSDMQIVNNNLYFIGTINSPDSIGDYYFEPVSYGDAFVAKANTDMTFAWAKMGGHITNHGDSYGIALFVSPDEEIFFTGYFRMHIVWDDFEIQGLGGFVAKCTADGNFLWLTPSFYPEADKPTDITANGEKVFVSTSYVSSQENEYFKHQVRAFNISTGVFETNTELTNRVVCLAYSSNDNSLILSQNADQLIRLSMLDDRSLNSEWSLLFSGNSAWSHSISAGIDKYGNLYNFGYASGPIDYFGQSIQKGLFLVRQDDTGDPLWSVQFADADNIRYVGNYLAMDTISNNIYITGRFYHPLVIPGGPTLVPENDGSIFLLKYDADGNYQWAIQEDFYSSFLDLACDKSGNILLSGIFENLINIGNTTLSSAGIDDVFIAKYDNNGQFLWAKRAGGDDLDWDGFISTDGQDNVYLTGEFYSYDVTVDDYAITLAEGDGNILFAKFDPQGNVQWVTVKGGSVASPVADYYGWPTGIHTDADGYSYIKGWHYDSAYFDNIVLTSLFKKPGYDNIWNKFVAKFDPDGNTIWAKSISELRYSWDYNQFDVDPSGNVYTGLTIRDTTLFGEDFMYINSGKNDLVVARYSDEGKLDWVKSIEDSETGSAGLNGIVTYNEKTAYVYGFFNDYLNFNPESFTVNNNTGFIGRLEGTTGINVYKREKEALLFDVFPNPAVLEISILIKDETVKATDLLITDITGKKVYSRQIENAQGKITVDITGFNPGVYFIKLKSGVKTDVKKFVVD